MIANNNTAASHDVAHFEGGADCPENWDKWVSAAYLRMMGNTQAASAKGAGVSRRSLQAWEADHRWPAAREEATERWLGGAVDLARGTLIASLKAGEAASARWLLERTDPRLAPPRLQHEISGLGGGPVEVRRHAEQVQAGVEAVLRSPEAMEAAARLAEAMEAAEEQAEHEIAQIKAQRPRAFINIPTEPQADATSAATVT